MAATGNSNSKFALGILRPAILALAVGLLTGCSWIQSNFGGEGFQRWNSDLGNVRADKKAPHPPEHSGYFLDTKAQQIEESLGGGFN